MGIGCRVIVVVQRSGHLSVMRVWAGVGVIVPIQGKRYRGWPEFLADVRDADFGIAWHVVPSSEMRGGYHGWEGSIH